MILKEYFLAQLDREATSIRKAIERIPDGHNRFKPHERSMEFGYVAALVAGMIGWITIVIDRDELDMSSPESDLFRTNTLPGKAELLASLDAAVVSARSALELTNDEHLAKPWALKLPTGFALKQSREIVITDSVFSHLAHHRGQLTVYLRLLEAKVPAIYGPSADERS